MLALKRSISRVGYRVGCRALRRLPRWPGERIFIQLLNRQLAVELEDGLFDFLDGQVLEVNVTDLGLELRVSKHGDHFVRVSAAVPADATISAGLADFFAIASGREDPDTLFFQRRLAIRGQTEIGLTVKNRLDAFDRNRIPRWAQRWLEVVATELATVAAS